MSGFFVYLNSMLKRKIFWISPILLLLLTLAPRSLKMPLLNMLCMFLAFFVALLSLFIGSVGCFGYGDDVRKQVIFYKSFGLGLLEQFLMRVFSLMLWTGFVYFGASSVMWDFDLKILLFAEVMVCSFMLFYSIGSFFNNRFLGTIPLFLYMASIFLPMYVIPNPAYIFKTSLGDAFIYSSVYVLFYIMSSYRFFVLSWRQQCIGSIS